MPAPLRVLTIDGGGMRGVYPAAFLHGLADQFAKDRGVDGLDIGKAFDIIVGTSTGAIIACALAKGVPMLKVVELYKEHGPKIFPQKLANGVGVLKQIPTRKHHLRKGAKALENALRGVLEDETFGSLYARRGIGLAIPAVEMAQQRSWVFKTSHWGGHRDDDVTLVDACMATSAAPIYRSLSSIDADDDLDGYRVFADGGLWANNPALVGLMEALKIDARTPEEKTRPIEIYSVGTLPCPQGGPIPKAKLARGIVGWKFGGEAASLSIAAQETAFDHIVGFLAEEFTSLGRQVETHRFPRGVLQPSRMPYLDLDDTSDEARNALLDQAREDVNVARMAASTKNDPTGQAINSLFMMMPERTED